MVEIDVNRMNSTPCVSISITISVDFISGVTTIII